MATNISSIDASIQKLTPTFQAAIKTTIEAERAPLNRVKSMKDTLDMRRGVYADVRANFDALQSAVQALISSQASYGLRLVSKASVIPGSSGTTVLVIGKAGESMAAADYDFNVGKLAKAESRATAAFSSPDIALGKSGTFWLGGTGVADLQSETAPDVYSTFVPTSTVTAATTSATAAGLRELGAGDYAVQVRNYGGTRQFRLVNADGDAVAINRADGATGVTAEWQAMRDGAFNTGRGQTLTLNTSGDLASTVFRYTAKGASISISAADTQRTIVSAINAAVQPDGRDFKASIVANQIVLNSVHTGANHSMVFTDGAGLGFNAVLQTAQNAEFTINGMSVSRASNNNLSDVVDGMTLSLAGDAEGKSARLSVSASADKAVGLVGAMVSKFNAALSHLRDKMATASKTENGKTTYTRGALSGETIFSHFRADMLQRMGRSYANSGSYKNLEEIGISFDKDMKLTFDSAKFSEAFKNNGSDVSTLLDKSMGDINTVLSRYSGSSGMLNRSISSMEAQGKEYDQRIVKYNASLELRKQALYNQYLEYQARLVELGNQATMFGIDLNSTINKLG